MKPRMYFFKEYKPDSNLHIGQKVFVNIKENFQVNTMNVDSLRNDYQSHWILTYKLYLQISTRSAGYYIFL